MPGMLFFLFFSQGKNLVSEIYLVPCIPGATVFMEIFSNFGAQQSLVYCLGRRERLGTT